MNSINIKQHELDAALNHFFTLNPTYERGGNIHGSFRTSLKDNSLHVDSVGTIRSIYEMVIGRTLDDLPNVYLMANETDYISPFTARPGDLIFSRGSVQMLISENSQLSCHSNEKGITIESWNAKELVGEVHRGFFRVSGS